MTEENDNVEYLPGKPGFYKKGAGAFKLNLGNLDELIEKAEEKEAEKQEAKRLKAVPEPDEQLDDKE
ncbi:MAG: hypothetical protein WC911_02355 [Thermoleophilia bacterium]